jgi:hypothetical protein
MRQLRRGGGVALVAILLSGVLVGTWILGLTLAGIHRNGQGHSISSLKEANDLLVKGCLPDVRREFYLELVKDSNSVKAIRGLAYCAIAEGDQFEAASLLRTWTELEPENVAAWREFARLLWQSGRQWEVMQAVRKGLAVAPGDSELMRISAESSESTATHPPASPRTPQESANARRTGR